MLNYDKNTKEVLLSDLKARGLEGLSTSGIEGRTLERWQKRAGFLEQGSVVSSIPQVESGDIKIEIVWGKQTNCLCRYLQKT